jgi:hypothetical protein
MKLFIVIFFLFVNQSVFAVTNTRLALVIGNSKYENLGGLQNTINDARGVEKSLRELGFKTKLIIDANEATLRKALKGFSSDSRAASLSLIYYAGHGAQINGENYLLPVDMEVPKNESDVQLSSLKVDDVVNSIKSQTKIIFLDACRDNPALNKSLAKGRGSFRGGLAAAKNSSYDDSGSLFIAYATDSGSIAQDGEGQKNSPFTTALLKYIKQPVSIDDMFSMVTRDVRLATKNSQKPYKYASIQGLICLTEKCGVASSIKIEQDLAPIQTSEDQDFKVASISNDVSILLNFIEKYPKNEKADDLFLKLSELGWGWNDNWVHFEYVPTMKVPVYIRPSSIKKIGNRRVFETKWFIENKTSVPGLPSDYFSHTYSYVVDCEKNSFFMYLMKAYDKNGKQIWDLQNADPRYVDLNDLSKDESDIVNISAKQACHPELLKPVVLKSDLVSDNWERLFSVNDDSDYFIYPKSIKNIGDKKDVVVKYSFKNPKKLSSTKLLDELYIPISQGYENVPVIKTIVIKDRFDCKKETFAVLNESFYDENDVYVGYRNFGKDYYVDVQKTGRIRDLMKRVCSS